MSLQPGHDIAHYHVLSKIGEGGMGEVWRATDRKLGRDVALKLLPATLSQEPERLARFQREAQVLASLNHPNIAAIYGLEQVDGETFLVLELVEGADLAERLAHGPLPLDETLDVARQIAEGLEVAHERGIVHRDLKPANVKRTADGKVKILDFGLAKALQEGGGEAVDSSLSPTITSLSTRAGVILGTAAYMSPEQARGSAVDRRADVWAFGCVLLELLTGDNPFREATVSDTLASILRSEPDWATLPSDTPAAVKWLLRRCLEKDPRRRLRDIGEARVVLEDLRNGAAEDVAEPAPVAAAGRSSWWLLVGAVAVTATLTAAIVSNLGDSSPRPFPRRFEIVPDAFSPRTPVISPDGRKIAYVGDEVWVRYLDRLDPVPLAGTEGASTVAWASDSQSVLFVAHGDLLAVPIAGGTPMTIAFNIGEVGNVGGIAVFDDRVAIASGDEAIREVSTRGGDPVNAVVPDGKEETDLHHPSFLPDGSILYVVHRGADGSDTIAVSRDGKPKYVLQTDGQQVFSPGYSPTGHLVYRRLGSKAGLWAAPFSPADLEVTGEPFLITTDGIHPSVAADGTLLYVRNASDGAMRSQLVWVERDGTIGDSVGPEMDGIGGPALSPDGKRVAIMRPTTEPGNIWVFDVAEGTRTRLTFGSPADWDPVWTVDGKEILFWEGASRAMVRVPADGSGGPQRIVKPDLLDSGIADVSPDGKWLVMWARTGPLEQDVLAIDLQGDGTPLPVLDSPAIENFPKVSPDGKYLAYTSNESGRVEVFLTRFPSGEGKWQVSTQGGRFPGWSPTGRELFFVAGTTMYAVPVALGNVPRLGEPAPLFDARDSGLRVGWNDRYTVSRDGERFLMIKSRQNEGTPPSLVVNYDWVPKAAP